MPDSPRWETRHTQVALVALCSAINYADRVNISIAVVDMKQAFKWDMATQAFVLSSFFWGCESSLWLPVSPCVLDAVGMRDANALSSAEMPRCLMLTTLSHCRLKWSPEFSEACICSLQISVPR